MHTLLAKPCSLRKEISGKVFYTVYIVYIFYRSFRLKTAGEIIHESQKNVF
jgi:hypothetical protein